MLLVLIRVVVSFVWYTLVKVVGSCLLQVSIEFGLSEMLNSMAIMPEVAPKDGKFDFKISDLEAMFPEGMVDHDVDPVYKEVINFSRPCLVLFLYVIFFEAFYSPSI